MRLSVEQCLAIIFCVFAHTSHGGLVVFLPRGEDPAFTDWNQPGKLEDWSLNPNSIVGRTIVSTSLFIEELLFWKIESDEMLYLKLLNHNNYTGINPYAEMEASGDYFVGRNSNISLVTYGDLLFYVTSFLSKNNFANHPHNISESQVATLMSFKGDGKFSMILDPDCRFFWGEDMNLIVNIPPPTPSAEIREWEEDLHIKDEGEVEEEVEFKAANN